MVYTQHVTPHSSDKRGHDRATVESSATTECRIRLDTPSRVAHRIKPPKLWAVPPSQALATQAHRPTTVNSNTLHHRRMNSVNCIVRVSEWGVPDLMYVKRILQEDRSARLQWALLRDLWYCMRSNDWSHSQDALEMGRGSLDVHTAAKHLWDLHS